MRKITKTILLFAFALIVNSALFAQLAGSYSVIEIPAPSLKGNILGSAETQKIGVYLPPSYNKSEKKYPVVYYLNGFTVQAGQYPPTNWLDSIMKNNLVQEMIYVEMGGYNMFEGTMYANSPISGNWEDFVTKDVINYVDKNYRTLTKRESRGIAGHSMGGAGTLHISLKHSDLYSVAYPMSPAVFVKGAMLEEIFGNPKAMKHFNKLEKKMEGVSDQEFAEKLKKELKIYKKRLNWPLGYGIAFAYNKNKPLRIDFPFDAEGNKDEEIWKKWLAGFGNLEAKVKKYEDNLRSYTHYSIDCGYQDGIKWISQATMAYSKILMDNEIPHSLHMYKGDHVNKVSTQLSNRVLPIMSMYLVKE